MLQLLKTLTIAAAVFASACVAQAQTARPATIDDAAWLAGRWVGEGLGGEMEEMWSPPAGGQMVGHFRLTRDGAPVFYELMFIDVVDGGLRMRLKHFNPDYTAWEEREEWTTFEPVSFSADEIVFSALTIRRVGEDQITMILRMRRDDGVREEVMHFRRTGP